MQKASKRIVAVVVTYNRINLLCECIDALIKNDCDILIVDNASTDGTEAILRQKYDKKIIYSNTGSNLGGAGGFNYGIRKAYEMGYDYLWIMDDDCIAHEDTLSELLKVNEELHEDYGFLASKVLWKDGSVCKMNVPKRTFGKWLKIDKVTRNTKIAMASFVSLFIKAETIKEFGLPIKDFFIWTDDWEFTRRISRKKDCYFVPKSVVTHKSNNNIGADISTEEGERLERYKYLYRNDRVLYRREGLHGKLLLLLRIAKHKLKIYLSDKDDKKERLKIIKDALKDGKNYSPEIEYVGNNNKTIKVLEMFGEPLNYGGQETFIINMYKNFKDKKIKYTFITPFEANNKTLTALVRQRGDSIIASGYNFDSKRRKSFFIRTVKAIADEGEYDVVHIHSGSILMLYKAASIFRKANFRRIIVHSHATGYDGLKHRIVRGLINLRFYRVSDYFFACSWAAGEFKYSKKILKSEKFAIIKNGIDLAEYSFNQETRNRKREELSLSGKTVICNVGRFSEEKNQLFLLDVFREYSNLNQNSVLLLIGGTGTMEQAIEDYIQKNNIGDGVILLKERKDIAELLCASDVFIFPSKFEGLGIAAVEAQASGLPVICSDNIPEEARLTSGLKAISLSNSPKYWAAQIDGLCTTINQRNKASKMMMACDFDAKQIANNLEGYYRQ